MTAWLIVNSFVDTPKFRSLYRALQEAASRRGVTLQIENRHSKFEGEDPEFILFWDKDIYFAQQLEQKGFRLYNSARAIEVCDNKILTAINLTGKVPIPTTVIAPKTYESCGYCNKEFLRQAIDTLGLPLIIKEAYGSFGQQVHLAHTYEEAASIVDTLGARPFLMQAFVASSCGRDIRVNVVGGRVVSAMLRYNPHDFRSNISNGGTGEPISLTPLQEAVAIRACCELGVDFAGVDLLFGAEDIPFVCEVNSNPHFLSSYACTGVNMAEHIIDLCLGG